jgi:hypothetical protein
MREELRASLGSFITLWNALAEWVTADTRACLQQLRSPPVAAAAAAAAAAGSAGDAAQVCQRHSLPLIVLILFHVRFAQFGSFQRICASAMRKRMRSMYTIYWSVRGLL